MEQQDLKRNPWPWVHLQWFSDGQSGGEGAADGTAAEGAEGEDGKGGEGEPGGQAELKADGIFLAQAPDKYKRDQKYLADLLQGEKAVKNWGDVLDRMYAAEAQATELAAKVPQVPQKAEEYEFEEIVFPDFMGGDAFLKQREDAAAFLKAKQDELRAVGLELGLSKEAVKRLAAREMAGQFAVFKAAQDFQAKQREEGMNALKAEWKGDFAAHEELARRAIRTFGGDKLVERISLMGLENDPVLVHTFYKIGKAIGEDTLVPGKAGPTGLSAQEQRARGLRDRYKRSPGMFEQGGGKPPAASSESREALKNRYPSMDTST